MEDGISIKCWKDSWLSSIGPLASIILANGNLSPDCSLNEMMMPDGSWNLDLFGLWLSNEIINRIVSILPSHPSTDRDKVIWTPSTSRSFSVRSAY